MADRVSRFEVRLSNPARRDIREILRWSEREFGRRAAERYDVLLNQALTDIGEDPERIGSQQRRDLAAGANVYPLRFSRERAKSDVGISVIHDIFSFTDDTQTSLR